MVTLSAMETSFCTLDRVIPFCDVTFGDPIFVTTFLGEFSHPIFPIWVNPHQPFDHWFTVRHICLHVLRGTRECSSPLSGTYTCVRKSFEICTGVFKSFGDIGVPTHVCKSFGICTCGPEPFGIRLCVCRLHRYACMFASLLGNKRRI